MSTDRKKILVLGCGHIGQRHLFHASNVADIVGVCDIDKDKATTLGNQYKTNIFYSLSDALNSLSHIDLVSVCTPNGLHAEHSISVLEKGINVLCEKPMAISTESAHKMIAAASSNNKKLFVVKQNRYNPPVEYLKNTIDSGTLGKIYSFQINGYWNRPAEYYKDWRGTLLLDGGTLYTQFSHFIDLILWLFGNVENATLIKGNYCHPNIEFEDTGIVSFKMEKGSIGAFHYTVNSFKKNMEGSITIFAENGTIKIGGEYLNELEYFNVKDLNKPTLAIGNGPNNYGTYSGSMSNHDKIYSNAIKALDDSHHPFLEATEAYKTVELIESLYEKAFYQKN